MATLSTTRRTSPDPTETAWTVTLFDQVLEKKRTQRYDAKAETLDAPVAQPG